MKRRDSRASCVEVTPGNDKGQAEVVRIASDKMRADSDGSSLTRRDAMLFLASLDVSVALVNPEPVGAAGAIAVLGAGGRTGRRCVEILQAAGRPVMALTRAEADVVKASKEDLASAIRSAGAVIFAASASSSGGNAKEVDEEGAIKAAQACALAGIPKFVLISSGGVARPGSLGYLATNWMPGPTWGIMDAKASSEEAIKRVLQNTATKFCILRPGGLEDSPPLGPGVMELNQGDVVGGLVSRSDVAAAAIAAADSRDTDSTTFELYAFGNAFAQQPGPTDLFLPAGRTGYERRGESWEDLFKGLKKDFSKL